MDAEYVKGLPKYFTDNLHVIKNNQPDKKKQRKAYDALVTPLKSVETIEKIREDYKDTQKNWTEVENLCNSLIDPNQPKGFSVARVAAMRLLAVLKGPEFGRVLLNIGIDQCEHHDLRAWAFYLLETAGLKPLPGDFDKIFQGGLNDDTNCKDREWAAYILGNLKWWNKYTNKKSEGLTRATIEGELINRWDQEIEIYVLCQLVKSLGQIGGYEFEPVAGKINWPVINVLEQAANHRNPLVRDLVPDALAGIGDSISKREQVAYEPKVQALNELLTLLGDTWLRNNLEEHNQAHHKQLNEGDHHACTEKVIVALNRLSVLEKTVWEISAKYDKGAEYLLIENELPLFKYAEEVLQTEGLDYDAYRAAIQAVASFIPIFFRGNVDPPDPTFIHIAGEGLALLLDKVDNIKIKVQPDHLRDKVRGRAVDAVRFLIDGPESTKSCREWICNEEKSPALPRLKKILADPSPEVAKVIIDTIIAIMGSKEAANYFVQVILYDDECDEAVSHRSKIWNQQDNSCADTVRERAALAIGSIINSNEACNLLAEKLKLEEEPAYGRAKKALEIMGGPQAASALLTASRRKWIEARFFDPIEKADTLGYNLLDKTERETTVSLWITRIIGVVVVLIGVILTALGINYIGKGDSSVYGAGGVLVGAVTLISGMLTSFFWNPAKVIQKANADMTCQITAFHGYLSRMRLLGLGFAYTYSTDKENQDFLVNVCTAAGDAVNDAGKLLNGIGAWPTTPVQVPDFKNKTWKDAYALAKTSGLDIGFDKLVYDDNIKAELIVSQSIAPQTSINPGSTVGLIISQGKKTNGTDGSKVPASTDNQGNTSSSH